MQSAHDNITAEVIMQIPHVLVHEVKGLQKVQIAEGSAVISNISSYNCLLLTVGEFKYSISKEIPVMIDKNKHPRLYILPNMDYNYCISIPNRNEVEGKLIESFEELLEVSCIVVDAKDFSESDEEKRAKMNEKSKKASQFVIGASDKIRAGMISAATAFSSNFKKGEAYIMKKIKIRKQTHIKPETINKVRIANTMTGAFCTFTLAQVDAIVKISKDVISEAGKQLKESKKGKQIAENKYYDPVMNIGGASLHAVACLYDGMVESLFVMGKELAKSTNNVVEYKYGEKAGELSKNTLETVGNVGSVAKVYKRAIVKGILEETGNKDNK